MLGLIVAKLAGTGSWVQALGEGVYLANTATARDRSVCSNYLLVSFQDPKIHGANTVCRNLRYSTGSIS